MKSFSARMLLMVIVGLSGFSVAASADDNIRDCGPGYGPSSDNLTIILSSDDVNQVQLIGYQIMGSFFSLRVKNCSHMTVSKADLLCDKTKVGSIREEKVCTDDLGYESLCASIDLSRESYELSGSCQDRIANPMTITFLRK